MLTAGYAVVAGRTTIASTQRPIALPRATTPPMNRPVETTPSPPGIAIVSQCVDERQQLRELVQPIACEHVLIEFQDHEAALSAGSEQRFACVFVSIDLSPPGYAAFLRLLAASNPSRNAPPAIAFGTRSLDSREAIQAGAQDYVRLDLDSREDVVRVMSLARQRQDASELRQRLELAERLATLGRLAAGVAHEINNPAAYALANLSELQGHLERLKTDLRARLPENTADVTAPIFSDLEEIEEMVNDSLEGVSRIATIVGELQQFARSKPHENRWTDLGEVAQTAARLTSNRVRHSARLLVELGPTKRLVADQGKLVQVVINLIDNASKALPGTANDLIRVSTGHDGDFTWLVVEDNGPGVSEALRGKIFEPFFTTDQSSHGTGLGLTLSREYAERHRGSLHFEPRPGGGSRFVLTIPLETGLYVPVGRAPRHSGRGTPASNRLLIVDDEPAVLRAYRRVLEPTYQVTPVSNGQSALDLIAQDSNFDAIICDVNMPHLGGVDFYQALELSHPELARRVVFCSGGVFGEDTREFIESTRNPVLHKPVSAQALLGALSGFLRHRG